MNGATLRVYRQLLGYESAHYADKIGVNRRTVIRWEQEEKPVPDDVAAQVRADLAQLEQLLARIRWDEANQGDAATLTAYRHGDALTAATGLSVDRQIYNAAVGLAALDLEAAGTEVTIRWDRDAE